MRRGSCERSFDGREREKNPENAENADRAETKRQRDRTNAGR